MSASTINTPKASRSSAAGRFIGGFAAGVFALPLLGAVIFAGVLASNELRIKPETRDVRPLSMVTAGAQITGAGGTSVIVERTTDVLRQDCRDGCDDLRIEAQPGTLNAVRVLDAKGGCVACRRVAAEPYREAQSRSWMVAGAPNLTITGDARE